MASIAEMERNTLSENVKIGIKQRAKEGSWNGGVVFVYDSVEKELIVNPRNSNCSTDLYLLFRR
jgi:site-specific DNA recombinase